MTPISELIIAEKKQENLDEKVREFELYINSDDWIDEDRLIYNIFYINEY